MRPIRLEVEGFTCFRDRIEVDFTELDLFAITGPTGSGKTSLIDALTFALFGATPRVGERGVSDLLSLGLNRMMVLLEFSRGAERYQISRTARRTRSSVSSERRLERWDGSQWVSLGSNHEDVKAQIQAILGLDFEGFNRSVVLPQGQFDRFLKGKPKERRDILSELLRLQKYERMRELAFNKKSQAQSAAEAKRHILDSQYQDATPENLKELEENLHQISSRERQTNETLGHIRSVLKPMARKLGDSERDLERANRELGELRSQIQASELRVESFQKDLLAGESELRELRKQLAGLSYDADLHLRLTGAVTSLRQLIQARRLRGERLNARVEKERDRREAEKAVAHAKKSLEKSTGSFQAALAARDEAEKESSQFRQSFGSADLLANLGDRLRRSSGPRAQLGQVFSDLKQLEKDVEDSRNKKHTLETGQAEATERLAEARRRREIRQAEFAAEDLRRELKVGCPCPVCGQDVLSLPAGGEDRSVDETQTEIERAEKHLAALQSELAKLSAEQGLFPRRKEELLRRQKEIGDELAVLDQEVSRRVGEAVSDAVAELERLCRLARTLEERLADAGNRLDEARSSREGVLMSLRESEQKFEKAGLEFEQLSDRLAEDEQSIRQLEKDLAEWDEVDQLEQQLEEQQRLKDSSETLKERIFEIETALGELRVQKAAEQAQAHQNRERAKLLAEESARISVELENLSHDFRKEAGGPETEPGGAESWVESEERRVDLEARSLLQQVSAMRGRLEAVARRIQEAATILEHVGKLEESAALASELHNLLRGNQFIDFVLGGVFDRLCTGGTLHFSQLSSGRYSFAFDGGEFQVVDHWNGDEQRPVTTLSGGESFLASLALALSLTESLDLWATERGSTALEALFLDEGFASLDAETLDVAVQGIEALAGSDRMIGVISHIPEFAERFPRRIEVEKGISGSRVSLA